MTAPKCELLVEVGVALEQEEEPAWPSVGLRLMALPQVSPPVASVLVAWPCGLVVEVLGEPLLWLRQTFGQSLLGPWLKVLAVAQLEVVSMKRTVVVPLLAHSSESAASHSGGRPPDS